jgi:hypothetical protein
MPLDYTSRNISAGGSSPYIPLITNNPAFQVKIVPVDGSMEQKPNQKNAAQDATNIGVGDTVRGEEVSQSRKDGERVMGRVVAVITDNGSITGYKILSGKGKEVIVDPTTAVKVELNGEDPLPSAQQVQLEQYTPENKVMLYEEWKQTHDK